MKHHRTPALTRSANLLADGSIRIRHSETVTFDVALDALGRFGSTRRRGKVMITAR